VSDRTATVSVNAEIDCRDGSDSVTFTLIDPDGEPVATSNVSVGESHACSSELNVRDAQFWWPVGLGKQPLYTISARLTRKACTSRLPILNLANT
jgi:beta-mannosidase